MLAPRLQNAAQLSQTVATLYWTKGPRAIAAQARASAAESRTLDQILQAYCDDAAAHPQWSARYADQFPSRVRTHAANLLGRDVRSITSADIIGALRPVWAVKSVTARNVKQSLHTLHEYACAHGFATRSADLWPDIDIALPTHSHAAKSNHAAAPWAEVPGILRRVQAETGTHEVTRDAFAFGVLCASRSGEVRGMRWGEVDLQRKVWTIPAERMKAGVEHAVPLAPAALAILRRQKRGSASALVFPSGRTGAQLPDNAFGQLLKRLEVASTEPDQSATYHGMRSAFRDWAAEQTDFPEPIVETALAHKQRDAVVAAYRRTDFFDRRRALMSACGAFCTGASHD
jgi:integrase